MQEQSASLKLEYDEKLAGIEEDAQAILKEAAEKAKAYQCQLMDEWQLDMDRKKRAFVEDTKAMQQQAIRKLRHHIGDLVILATEQVIQGKIEKGDVDDSLEDIMLRIERDL